jgi:predicted nucleic acid-binding protein
VVLVVDASVGLKWVLNEPDSAAADALLRSGETLLVPDFWLNEVANVLWVRVRRGLLPPGQARAGLALLRAAVAPSPTAGLELQEVALDIGLAVNHSPYDTLYVAFAIAMAARRVVVADAAFVRAMRSHPDPALASMPLPLADWAQARGS